MKKELQTSGNCFKGMLLSHFLLVYLFTQQQNIYQILQDTTKPYSENFIFCKKNKGKN
jgi:hypothetical protein